MPSNAYNKFDKTIRRCESLVESYSTLHELSQGDDMLPGREILCAVQWCWGFQHSMHM